MSERKDSGVPFASDDEQEQRLWADLQQLPQAEPAPLLRRRFYGELDRIGRSTRTDRLRGWLGLRGMQGVLTAFGCIVLGVLVGVALRTTPPADRSELTVLQQQVAELNRNLILDRLDSDSASKRLRGVIDAAGLADQDSEIAHALLTRAIDDRVYSVRAAAIDAIGPQLNEPGVGEELMALLERSESPIVQLALVDLVLRHGNDGQLERLVQLSERGVLRPELVEHVRSAIRRKQV
jgi:hypothetical protein